MDELTELYKLTLAYGFIYGEASVFSPEEYFFDL